MLVLAVAQRRLCYILRPVRAWYNDLFARLPRQTAVIYPIMVKHDHRALLMEIYSVE